MDPKMLDIAPTPVKAPGYQIIEKDWPLDCPRDEPAEQMSISGPVIDNIKKAHAALCPLDKSGYWYLASPYEQYPYGHDRATTDVAQIAANLVERGIVVFAPIVHSHHLVPWLSRKLTHQEWLNFDVPFLDAAVGLIVAKMPGWHNSNGVQFEMAYMHKRGKPVFLLPVDVARNPVALI
ncbi:DUF1937 family protein [Methylocystis hirsuta]|nr:DUF1937 family protein [Methylocystis hirsuta]